MQGLWKNSVCGWSHKDSKRKKQTHKHLVKDKYRAMVNADRRGDKNLPLYEEGEVVYLEEEPIYTKHVWIEVWKIELTRHRFVGRDSLSLREAYNWRGVWYDDYTNEPIELLGRSVKKLAFLYKVEEQLERPIKEHQHKRWTSGWSTGSTTFLYGKPIRNKLKYWDDGKRRKYAQKYANSRDRQRVRTWVGKRDWDAEVKTHALSKSILWEIW